MAPKPSSEDDTKERLPFYQLRNQTGSMALSLMLVMRKALNLGMAGRY